jgi:alkanesulfonate monooxygenase SsuD/methylene tetrahydromethanopterin reductase-like flavin-dependent oxidoreductase (luciferase family)
MNLGLVLDPAQDAALTLDQARSAEAAGFGAVAIGDSFALLGSLAAVTRRVRLMVLPTNAVTRHPSVIAREIAVVDDVSNGRAVLVLGRGYSAVLSIGHQPATTAVLRDYVGAVRSSFDAGDTRAAMPEKWKGGGSASVGSRSRSVPIYLAAYGPRTMRLAGMVADGVIVTAAAAPERMRDAIEVVRAGAISAGRDPGTVAITAFVRASVRKTRSAALSDISASLAAGGLKLRLDDPTLPEALRPRLAELHRRYVRSEHTKWKGANAQLVDGLGLTPYLADRLAICGTTEEVLGRLAELAELGVGQVILAGVFPDAFDVLRPLAELAKGMRSGHRQKHPS